MSNGVVTIEGRVQYQAPNGDLRPSPQTTILIRKRTAVAPTNKKIATTTTNDDGYYSVRLDVAKWESNVDFDKKLRLRVQALSLNPAVNVVNFGKNLGTANGNTWTINNDGTVKRSASTKQVDFTITGQDERRAFQIANWTLQEYRFVRRETGWTRRRVKARYPAVNNPQAQFRGFLEKFNLGSNRWKGTPRDTTFHEYGHAVMSGLFGYRGWQIPKYKGSHNIWSETGRIYAWYEGFAQFMEAATVDDPQVEDADTAHSVHGEDIETYPYYNDGKSHGGGTPGSDTGDLDGAQVEGAVANILWDVYDPANEPHDEIDGSLGEIFDAVDETDNKAWGRAFNNGRTRDVHDFFIQYVDNNPNQHEELRKIYFEYGINKPDRFEHDYSGSGSCTIHAYPCAKLDADKWSKLTPVTSVDVGLHSNDDDYYRFTTEKGNRITVNATVANKGPDGTGDMRVVVGQSKSSGGGTVANALGTVTENYPDEQVTFTAPKDGTYYVHVSDESSRRGGDLTYTLSITAFDPPVYHQVVQNRLVYSRNIEQLPGILRGVFAGERVNLKVQTDDDAVETVGLVMDGTNVSDVRRGGLENPTLVVETSEQTFENVTTADDPTAEAAAAFDRGEISYHGVGVGKTLKFTGTKIVAGVTEFIGDTIGIGPFG